MLPKPHGGCATDIIVVRHVDGTLSCTSFHVHFGKKWRDRLVEVSVNDVKSTVFMRVNDHGFAMWNSTAAVSSSASSLSDVELEETSIPSEEFDEVEEEPWSSDDETSSHTAELHGLDSLLKDNHHQPLLVPLIHQSSEVEVPLRVYASKDSPSPCTSLDTTAMKRLGSPPKKGVTTSPLLSAAPELRSGADSIKPLFQFPVPTHKPSLAELRAMNFSYGHNDISFNILGEKWGASAAVYCWDDSDRLIISDVDGTITKSDLLGHAYAFAGYGDHWIHPGICSLYSSISRNGYHLVYLTARSMHQARSTRSFLFSLQQSRVFLPKGPLFASPSSFFRALTQEVGRRSHIFKIHCLHDIRRAFCNEVNPFFAAFGNRINDYVAYSEAGVPPRRIYLLDSKSSVKLSRMTFHIANAGDPSLLDARFPPRRQRVPSSREATTAPVELLSPLTAVPANTECSRPVSETAAGSLHSDPNAVRLPTTSFSVPFSPVTRDEVDVEQEFFDHMFWHIDPAALISGTPASTAKGNPEVERQSAAASRRRRFFFFGGSGTKPH